MALSDYEAERARNIARNNARLRELGLLTAQEEEASNARACGKQPALGKPTKEKKREKENTTATSSPVRKSRRLQGIKVEVEGFQDSPRPTRTLATKEPKEEESTRRLQRQAEALELYHKHDPKSSSVKVPQTATYTHCLHRVRTMSVPALHRRVNVIEKAAGKHCVVKMAIFVACLRDEGCEENLVAAASEALERLKELQPPPATLAESEAALR